ncbi:MAG: AraC family transcriptional regulator [Rectinemataceae bacterium]
MRFEDFVFVYHLLDEAQITWHGRLHSHAGGLYELHYFISGEGSFRDGGAVFSIAPGSLYLTPPGATHQIAATNVRKPMTYYALLMDAEGDEEAQSLLEVLGARRGSFAIGPSQRFFFADLLEKSASGRPDLEKAAYHGLLAFLYGLAAGQVAARGTADNAHVEKALAIMQGAIERRLDLRALCDRIRLSREHFVRVFTERMGMPPMRYYSRLKVEAARAMLSSTNLRVQEIADKLGYENQFSFARAFKRVSGMPPTRFRAACIQRADFAAGSPSPAPAVDRPWRRRFSGGYTRLMVFTCVDEIEISGGSEEERRRAAALILAAESVDEGRASRRETLQARGAQPRPSLLLRLESVDGLPEEEIQALAPQFPDLSFTLVYFSLDGEFFGYAKVGAAGGAAESEDFAEDTREIVGRRHDGDGIAFVRAAFSLARPEA